MRVNEPEQGNGLRVSESPRLTRSLEAAMVANPECNSGVSPRIVGYNFINPHLLSPSKLHRDQDFELEGYSRQESTSHSDDQPPPLGVELTGYRLLNMSVVFAFGLANGILTYMGHSTMPTTLYWVSGAILAVM